MVTLAKDPPRPLSETLIFDTIEIHKSAGCNEIFERINALQTISGEQIRVEILRSLHMDRE
jgi:hypothetical protein